MVPIGRDEMRTGFSLRDAKAWEQSDEQFIFCIDILEISAHDKDADALVNELEAFFTEMLSQNEDFEDFLEAIKVDA